MEKRLSYIDWAKAIGIVLICIGHFLPYGDTVKVIFYTFHVPLFAFVSGTLIKIPERFLDCLKRIGALLLRVGIPYTVWHLLSSLLYLHRGLRTLGDVWRTWLFLDGKTIWNDALWYAPSILIVTAVFYLLASLLRGNKYGALSLSALSLLGFVLMEKYNVPVKAFGYSNFLGTQNLLLLFGFLALGFACKDAIKRMITVRDTPYKNPFLYGCAAAFFIFLLTAERLNHQNNISLLYGDYNNVYVLTVMAVLLVITLLPACALLPHSRLAGLLSRHSLFMMCSHLFLFRWWVLDAGIPDVLETAPIRWVLGIAAVLLCTVICLLAELLYKRFPACGRLLVHLGMKF